MNNQCVTCSSCTFLFSEKKGGKYCHERGVAPQSEVCRAFKADVQQLRSIKGQPVLLDLFEAIRKVPADLLPIVASLLLAERKTRKTKFKLLQPVIINYSGTGEYLSDYCHALVLDADEFQVRVINRKGTFVATFPLESTSIYTMAEFQSLRSSLKSKNKVVRPVTPKFKFDEVIPTIDTVVAEKKLSKSKLRKIDLSTLFKLTGS